MFQFNQDILSSLRNHRTTIMTDNLYRKVNRETPIGIEVPRTWAAFAMWAAARFGVGILVAAVFGFWLMQVYRDLRTDADRVLTAFERQASINAEMAASIRQLTLTITQFNLASIQASREELERMKARP